VVGEVADDRICRCLHRDAELEVVPGHVASHAVARAGEADAKLNSHDIKVGAMLLADESAADGTTPVRNEIGTHRDEEVALTEECLSGFRISAVVGRGLNRYRSCSFPDSKSDSEWGWQHFHPWGLKPSWKGRIDE
jgi:hypothetical protein